VSDSGWILISHILTNPTPSFVSRGDMILGIVLLRPTDWPCTMIVCCTGCWSFLGPCSARVSRTAGIASSQRLDVELYVVVGMLQSICRRHACCSLRVRVRVRVRLRPKVRVRLPAGRASPRPRSRGPRGRPAREIRGDIGRCRRDVWGCRGDVGEI